MTLPSRTPEASHGRRLPRVLSFSTPHCPNCRAIRPMLDALTAEYSDRIEVVAVSADTNRAAAARHRVRGVPTLVAMEGEREVARHVGRGTETDLRALFDAAIDRVPTRRRISRQDRIIRTASGAALIAISAVAAVPWLSAAGVAFVVGGWWDTLRR